MNSTNRTPYLKLKATMHEKEINQSDIAKVLNISVSTVSKKLNLINQDFTLNDIHMICSTYGISADLFYI